MNSTTPFICRGIRGAITVESNTPEDIYSATTELLTELFESNAIDPEYVASILFTVTPDLNAAFPALAARRMGYDLIPLMCISEIPVPGALPFTIRILINVNTDKAQHEIQHCYLKGATVLRPDLKK